MNTISAIALDRLQTENESLRRQLAQALAYQQQLETCLLTAPLYRDKPGSSYERTKERWAQLHRPVIDRAAQRFITERNRVKTAIMGKMKVWHQRIGNLVQRQLYGDSEVRIPTAQEILERFMMDLATI